MEIETNKFLKKWKFKTITKTGQMTIAYTGKGHIKLKRELIYNIRTLVAQTVAKQQHQWPRPGPSKEIIFIKWLFVFVS